MTEPTTEAGRARWEVLAWCGAKARERDRFLSLYVVDDGGFGIEYPFGGDLGSGAYYRQGGREWILCYREDQTPERLALLAHANNVLRSLAAIEAEAAARERERIRVAVQRIPDDEVADIDVVAREAVVAAIEGASE